MGNKAQYLRIQAGHLADAGNHAAAIELLDRLFAEFPERIELAQAHAQRAESLAILGQIQAVIEEYRAALQTERDVPNVRTNAWLEFGWFVVERQLTDYYGEVSQVLQEFYEEGSLKFPAIEFRYTAIQALLADHRGDKVRARYFAQKALAEAAKGHSGVLYHPAVGLVGSELNAFAIRLRTLADSGQNVADTEMNGMSRLCDDGAG